MTQIAPTAFFGKTFDEALTLLVQTRDYIAVGVGGRPVGRTADEQLRFARETMRVTARLTQVMAWLLIQKAVHAGAIGPRQAAGDDLRLAGQKVCTEHNEIDHAGLPLSLQRLLARSHALYVRVSRLDELVRRAAE